MAAELLVIRTPSGLSGDMMLTGLARLLALSDSDLEERCLRIGVPALQGVLSIAPRFVSGIGGWTAQVSLPREHAHRGLGDIVQIIEHSHLQDSARAVAIATFDRLAQVEGEIHGIAPSQVEFHEVGALDSILDICLVAELHAELGSPVVVCSPLPVCDGVVHCQHGLLATPAPATLRMLEGVPVYGINATGETVTPTALALLHALRATYGGWPALTVRRTARAYGARVIPGVPNGALFACGPVAEPAQATAVLPAPQATHAPVDYLHASHAHTHPHD